MHITNIHARESFRQNSYVSKAAKAVIAGFGIDGYALAIIGLARLAGAQEKAESMTLNRKGSMAKSPKSPVVDRELIQELTKLLDETGLTEIEIEQDGTARARRPHRRPRRGAGACRGRALAGRPLADR